MSEHENIPDRSLAEKHFILGGATETIVYGRHFMTKPPAIFLSQEKKMIINVLWSGISIQTIPSSASSLEVIKYRDILNVLIPSEGKEKELSIVYNNRKVATGKNPQTTVTFRSEDRQGFLADFFRGVDKFAESQSMKFLCGISMNFMTINAYFIMDKATKSHFECTLTCYNSHLLIEFIKPGNNIAEDKFTKISKAMVITKTQEEKGNSQQGQGIDGQQMNIQSISQENQVKSQGDSNNANYNNQLDSSSTPQAQPNTPQQISNDTPSSQVSLDHNSSTLSGPSPLKHSLAIRYKDILRIQKKQNGFQINLLRPSLSLAFFNNDLNIINGFINKLVKNANDSTHFQISVTATLQEEIHHFHNIDQTQFEVDFAIDAKRVVPSKTHKRSCVLTMGRNGIAEVDRIHGEIYEAYDMKHLKDIVREEHSGSVRNSLKLVFFNGIEVEYVFKPFQRDVFVVELLTNVNMYYESQAPCRRCLDIIHSRTPNYALEIRGWKVETGVAERDIEVDAELIRNIALAKGEDKFFSALREFNVNCHLKRTNDADVAIYRQLVTTLGKYLMVFDDPDLLFFIKHLKILKAIPRNFGIHNKNDLGRQEKGSQEGKESENNKNNQGDLKLEQEQSNLIQIDGSLKLEDEDFVQLMRSSNKLSKFGQRAVKGNNQQGSSQQSSNKSDIQQGISGDYQDNESDDHSVDGKNFEELFVDDEEIIPVTTTKNQKVKLEQQFQPFPFPSTSQQQLSLSSSSSLKDQAITDETAAQQKALNGTQPKIISNNDLQTPAKIEPSEEILMSQMQTTKSQIDKTDLKINSTIKRNNRNDESPSKQESSSSSSRSKSTKPFGLQQQQGHVMHRPQALAQYFNRAATLDISQGDNNKRNISPTPKSIVQSTNLNNNQVLRQAATVEIDSNSNTIKTQQIQSPLQPQPSEISNSSIMIKRLDRLRQTQQYSIDEEQLIHSMREKSLGLLKKLKKHWIKGINGEHTLKLDFPSVESHLLKVEELLKCLTLFQNCKRYFEDMTVKKERFKEFKSILQLLSCHDPLIVYQTSQLFRKIGLYHSNTMQKAETDNKTFLLDSRLNILDRIIYAIANFTLVKRPLLRHSTFMIRIFSCYSIINTLFQARIESTAPLHRSQIIHYLQSPVFFAVANRIMHYQSFALTVNTINLLNALYYFSTENKQFINMLLLNSTILLQLLHLVIQDIYSSKQLKDIAFNLLFSLLNQRSQACFVVMNIFPKQIFKMQKTESLFVDQWTKQEWHNFFFKEIQTDIRNPHYFWLSTNLTYLDDMLIKEDKEFLAQQIAELFKKINHAKDLEQFFPRLFIKDPVAQDITGNTNNNNNIAVSEVWNSGIRSVAATNSTQENSAIKSMMGSGITTHNPNMQSGINNTINNPQLNNSLLSAGVIQQSKSKDKDNIKVILSPEDICNRELQKEIFAGVFWNIDDFRVEYTNVEDQQLCGRYYLKQLMSEGKKLMYEFLDGKGQIIEKEVKELWESLVLSLMSEQSQPRQALVIKTMCAVLREYAKVIKFTNLLPYIIRCLNLREFQELQYSQLQLLAVAVNCEDSQSKQYHCRMLSEGHNTIQELMYVLLSRVSVGIDVTPVRYGEDSTNMKLKTVRYKSEENLAVIFSVLKVLQAVIGNHSHVIRKRKIFPLTKPQQILMEETCMKALLNILLIVPHNDNIIGDQINWSNQLEMELAGFRSGQYHGLVRSEFLKLLFNYLLSPSLLQIQGFCEMLVYQIDDQTARLSFSIIKALFNMLPQAQSILDDLTEGPGLQQRHLLAFPFFKFFPVPFLLILLTGDPEDEKDDDNNGNQQQLTATGTGSSVVYSSTKTNPNNNTPFSSSTPQVQPQQQSPLDPTVEQTCMNFRAHSEERYDLIWTAEMRQYLFAKLKDFLETQNLKIDNFYKDNFHPSTSKWNSFRGMTDSLLKSFPIIDKSFLGMVMYPQLKNELSVCQIYLRPWSMSIEIEHGYLPVSFAEKAIKKITQYSSLPDIFKVINNNSSSAARNLLFLLKAQTKIFRLNIPLEIQYPYNALLLLLANSSNTLKSHLQDPSQFSDIDEQALEDLQLTHSPLLSQVKRNSFIGRAPQEKVTGGGGGNGSNQNSLLLSPRNRPSDRVRRQSIESQSIHGSSIFGSLDLSFSQPLVDSFQSTFNNYIKKILKIISLSLNKNENVTIFCENPTRISCILSVLNNIVLQTSLKNIGKQEIREYFEDVSVSYSEMKILNYGIRILHRINESAKSTLMKLSQQQRNDMCLLLQRGQKITVTFFKTFVEKYNAPLSPWTSREKYGNSLSVPDRGGRSSKSSNSSGSKKLTSKEAKNAQPTAASHPTYEQLLDRLFNVDPESLTGTNNSVVVDKCFGACRELNDRLSRFVLSLSNNAYFLECLIRGGCIWRLIEIILVKGKQFNPLHNSQKQKNVAHLDEIALISAKTMFLVLYNSDFIVKQTKNTGKDERKQLEIGESEFKEVRALDDQQKDFKTAQFLQEPPIEQQQQSDSSTERQPFQRKEKDDLPKIKPQYKVESEIIIEEEQSRISAEDQKLDSLQLAKQQQSSLTQTTPQSKDKESGEIKIKTIKRGRNKNIDDNDDNDEDDYDEEEQDECEASEQVSSVKKILSEGEKKELEYIIKQLLNEIGSLGRDKLGFFVDQFMTALVRNVDEHLLSYLRDQKYDQFTRKINSNIELPDFIWNQLSRDNLDLNLKLQIIKVNQTLGRVFIDKLLEHQGVIKVEDRSETDKGISANNTSFDTKGSGSNLNLNKTNSKRDEQQSPGVGASGTNQQQLLDQEVVISGVLLRVFNETDNFELTNPQSFQQEIFNQLKKYINEIDNILSESMLVPVYDPLTMNQPFEIQAKAVKECIKAIYSVLTRYQGYYVILNPVNIATFFRLLQMELDNKMSLSAFKISIAKILNELSGSIQGAKTLMASDTYVRYIITNLLESSTMATPIVQQFLNSVQKLARIPENLAPLVNRRIAGVLLLNTLKKEFFKPALRVQVVDVLNEIFNLNPVFVSFTKKVLPARISQKLFSENQPRQSSEVIDILENISFTSDLLWTNLMRLELIMTLEEDVKMFLKDSNENREQLAPQYPEMQNEIISTQIFIRIFNLTPAQTKLSDFNELVPSMLQDKISSKQFVSMKFSDLFLENLIQLTEQFSQKFIELQDESLAKRKEVLIKQESAVQITPPGQQESEITSENQQTTQENQQGQQENLDPFFQEFDRISTSYITALTSLMLCIEHIIIQEKRQIASNLLPQICKQFKILSENRSHSHLKSTVIQIAYLLKDQPNIHSALIESQFYMHVAQALSYSLENSAEQDYLTGIEQVIILNLLIKLIRDKLTNWRKRTIEENKLHCLPVICRLLETIQEENSYIKSYLISYCAEVLKSGFCQEEIANIIDMTTFSSKQLIASKNTNCEWVNLWRGNILNYGESNCLGEMQQQQDHQIVIYDGFFTLPIQSEFSIQSLPFPPQCKKDRNIIQITRFLITFCLFDFSDKEYLTRLQEIEEFKIIYEKGSPFKRIGQAGSILLDQAN